MKKIATVIVSLLVCASAFATTGNNGGGNGGCGVGQQTNGCGGDVGNGGTGTGVGVGVGVGVGIAGAAASSTSNSNANAAAIQRQVATGGNASANGGKATSSAAGGAGGSAEAVGGAGGAGVGSVDVKVQGGDTTYREAAQTAYAPAVPTVAKSCRLFIGLGGSSRDGSGSGGIPIANDQTCLSVTSAQLMIEVNKAFPDAFKVHEVRAAVCKIEGMAEMSSCK